MRLPVSVGSGMRVWASSKRMDAGGNAGFLQRGDQLLADPGFPAGHAFDGQEAHEALDGGLRVDSKHALGFSLTGRRGTAR